jgi:hypothetical protein
MAGVKGRSGGRRPNSGPKPMSNLDKLVTGSRSNVVAHPSSPVSQDSDLPAIDEFDAPNDLTTDERNVWLELAPHAFAARTLTKGTAVAFKLMCRNVLLERELRASVLDRGRPAHQGMIAKLDAELQRFNLSPCGKPMFEARPAEKVNPLKKYIG